MLELMGRGELWGKYRGKRPLWGPSGDRWISNLGVASSRRARIDKGPPVDHRQLNTYHLRQCCNTLHRCNHLNKILNITVHQPPGYKTEMSLTYNKNTHAHAHALIKHQQELLQQSLKINTCTTAMSKSSRWCWKKKSLQMQVLWHTMKERGRLSLNHQQFWCAHVREDKGDSLFLATRNWNLLNQAANTQSDSPIGSLSVRVSCLAGMAVSVVNLVRRQMDSDDKPSAMCPSRCMLWHFPSAPFKTSVNQLPITFAAETNNKRNKWKEQKKD